MPMLSKNSSANRNSAAPALAQAGIKSLAPETRKILQDYVDLQAKKRLIDAEASVIAKAYDSAKAQVAVLLDGAQAGICDNSVLVKATTTADSRATIKLKNGDTIYLDDVTSVMVGNTHYTRDQILSLYGGKSGSTRIDVSGLNPST